MTTFSIGLRTYPRTGVDYLSQTVQRLEETGTIGHAAVLGFHVTNGEGVSSIENGLRALELAAADAPDWVLFLEDDIDVIGDFVGSTTRWLAAHERPAVHLYPLACQYSRRFQPGMTAWAYPTKNYYASQALLLRCSKVADFVAWARENWKPHRGFDLALARWHEQAEPHQGHLLTPVPCFVDHTGVVSSMGCAVGRFVGFGGRDYSYTAQEVDIRG